MISWIPFVGCGGGHVWSDWRETDRWRVTPFENKSEQGLRRQYERHCERANCSATETEWRRVGTVDASEANDVLERLPEECSPEYQCPCCKRTHEKKDIETVRISIRDGARFEWACPTSGLSFQKHRWTKV